MSGFVYFIAAYWGAPVKIGWAAVPERRLRELQIANHAELRIIAAVPGSKEDEREMHRWFAPQRHRGEWFCWTQELGDFLVWLARDGRLSVGEAAIVLSVTPAQLMREVLGGRLPCAVVRGKPVFEMAALEAFVEEIGKYGEKGKDGRWS